LNEGIVEYKHDCGYIPHPLPIVVQHLTQVADISHFRVAQTKFPGTVRTPYQEIRICAYQTINEVYKTRAAMTTVMIRPGTNPRTEYEYGNDIMAKQIYSANNSAAVY